MTSVLYGQWKSNREQSRMASQSFQISSLVPWMWLYEGEAVINISRLSSAEAYNFESGFLGKKA